MKRNWLKNFGFGLLAFASAFVTACSDSESNNMAGGVSEETNVAQNIVLTGVIQATYSASGFASLDGSVVTPYIRGVKFCKLDSLSLEVGECVDVDVADNSSYELNTRSDWRFGLMIVYASKVDESNEEWDDMSEGEKDAYFEDCRYSLHAILDARHSSAANVNILTEWKYFHVKELLGSGMDVANAMDRAESDILDSLGISGDYEFFGAMDYADTTQSAAALVTALYLLGEPSDSASIKDMIGFGLSFEIRDNYINNPVFWAYMGLDLPGENFINLVGKYVSNAMVEYADIGLCKEDNDGQILTTETTDFGKVTGDMVEAGLGLKCEDGFWIWYMPGLEHVVENMTDSRDGRVYKTTSVTIEGAVQTWMAEDLKYALSSSACLDDSTENCEKYGRLYTWMDLMQIDTTSKSVASVVTDAGDYQGICPDGWRIPSVKDWKNLMAYVGNDSIAYKLMKSGVWFNSYLRIGGGGLIAGKFNSYKRTSDVVEFSAVPNESAPYGGRYASIPSFNEGDEDYHLTSVVFSSSNTDVEWGNMDDEEESPVRMGVRCIKK